MKTTVTKKMDATVLQFNHILSKLNNSKNLVIGGTHALYLHGINLGKDPDDLDIIIYKPTKEQLEILAILREVSEGDCADSSHGNRSLKLKKNGKCLDILLEDKASMPEGLLQYVNETGTITGNVQSVQGVIDAKASYGRSKDHLDMIKWKNLNFNT
tara:strand:- start:6670 stop:7140 length:471 start_codon:yes stop_codon:yes gene_type:complete